MGKMKQCPECMAEIHWDARKCRYCGSKQPRGGWFMSTIGILILILIMLWLLAALFGG